MKRYLLASASSLALASSAAAADMPVIPTKAPPAVMAPTWTGPYAGLNLGAVRHKAKYTESTIPDDASVSATGVTLGAQIGYNWQWQNYVTGVEADINWLDADGSTTNATPSLFRTDLPWLATFRVRGGVTITPPTLLYLTGGLAVGRVENEVDLALLGFPSIERKGTQVGWTVGGGIEHVFAPNWTAKAEVLYVDLGSKSGRDLGGIAGYVSRFKNTAVIGRVGINLKW